MCARILSGMARTHRTQSNQAIADLIDRHVGSRVAQRRQDMRYTQVQLADAVGVTFQQIQKYERGTNRIAASRLWQMADFLNTDINFFFDGVAMTEKLHTAPKRTATRRSAEIARRATDLSARHQKLVLDLMEQLCQVPTETTS